MGISGSYGNFLPPKWTGRYILPLHKVTGEINIPAHFHLPEQSRISAAKKDEAETSFRALGIH